MALMISYLFGVTSFRADSVTDGWEIVEGIFEVVFQQVSYFLKFLLLLVCTLSCATFMEVLFLLLY